MEKGLLISFSSYTAILRMNIVYLIAFTAHIHANKSFSKTVPISTWRAFESADDKIKTHYLKPGMCIVVARITSRTLNVVDGNSYNFPDRWRWPR